MGTCPCQCSKTLEHRLLGPQYRTFYLCIIGQLVICHALTLTVTGSEVLLNGIQLWVGSGLCVALLEPDSEISFLCTFFFFTYFQSLPSWLPVLHFLHWLDVKINFCATLPYILSFIFLFCFLFFCGGGVGGCLCACTHIHTDVLPVHQVHILYFFLHISMHVFKNRAPSFLQCPQVIAGSTSQNQQCDWFMPSSFWWKTYSLSHWPPLISFFLEHFTFDSSKFIIYTFCFCSCSFWFGLSVRNITGIGWALQCTLYPALTKSCKRDWIRGVWHQSWLHVTKSY